MPVALFDAIGKLLKWQLISICGVKPQGAADCLSKEWLEEN